MIWILKEGSVSISLTPLASGIRLLIADRSQEVSLDMGTRIANWLASTIVECANESSEIAMQMVGAAQQEIK